MQFSQYAYRLSRPSASIGDNSLEKKNIIHSMSQLCAVENTIFMENIADGKSAPMSKRSFIEMPLRMVPLKFMRDTLHCTVHPKFGCSPRVNLSGWMLRSDLVLVLPLFFLAPRFASCPVISLNPASPRTLSFRVTVPHHATAIPHESCQTSVQVSAVKCEAMVLP